MNEQLLATKALAFYRALSWQEHVADPEGSYNALLAQRIDEVRIDPDVQYSLATYPDTLHFGVLVTPDDPDTIAVLPVIARIVAACPRFDLRILRDDDDLTLFDALVDDVDLVDHLDDLDLPQLFLFDDEWQVQDQWGPRPQAADEKLDRWLEENPAYEALADSDDDVEQDEWYAMLDDLINTMRLWYNSGLNQACVREIHGLLLSLQSDDSGDSGDGGNNDDDDDDGGNSGGNSGGSSGADENHRTDSNRRSGRGSKRGSNRKESKRG